jgi:hypothetical protein
MEIKNSESLITLNRVLLGISILIIVNHKNVNIYFEKILRSFGFKPLDFTKKENKNKTDFTRLLILTPVLMMMYYDYGSESWTSAVGLNKIIPGGNQSYNFILRTLGVYGVAYTFSKKLSITKGVNQFLISENPIMRFFVLWGIAYSFTKSRSGGLMGILLHFMMKYNVSANITE